MIEITTQLVKRLIRQQFPGWKELEVYPVEKNGHDNRTFHLGSHMAVRLPSGSDYAAQIEKEAKWLPVLEKHLTLPIPGPIEIGKPTKDYPFPWSINHYIEGETLTRDNIDDKVLFAKQLSAFLKELQGIKTEGAPEAGKHNFFRGASPDIYSEQVYKALNQHQRTFPAEKLKKLWEEAVSSKWEHAPVWIHGDIAPGNLLVKNGMLCGVIDFGIMGIGDPACDYAMAWTYFDENSRQSFLQGLDNETINRARGWALWKALITCMDPNQEIVENAHRTLEEILHHS